MKTNKEMRTKILEKMAENIRDDKSLFENIECERNIHAGMEIPKFEWRCEKYPHSSENNFILRFDLFKYRIKPETITLKNGVEIPKPLDFNKIKEACDRNEHFPIFSPSNFCDELYASLLLDYTATGDYGKYAIFYDNKEDAITASKALFGIE